jgi:hypothetical protein
VTDKTPTDITLAPRHAAQEARYASADEFFSLAGKIITEEVYVPALDRTLLVKALTAADIQRARMDIVERRSGVNHPRADRDFTAMVVYYGTVNPDGSQFFHSGQIDMLNTKTNNAVIQPPYKVIARLSGLDDEAEELARKKHFEGSGKSA